jgi:type I restriction enzyme S subunit
MSKEKLIPELRFPEFENEGEWVENVLSNITDAIFDGTHQTPTYTESGIPFFSVENIVSGNKNKFISREDYGFATNKNKPEKGDILLTRIGKIGFSAIVDWDYEFSIYVTLACIKQSKHFNSYYLHSYFQSSTYQKEIRSQSLLNAVPMKINMDELRKTKVLLPPDDEKREQQKIASCLSSLDDLIANNSQKLELLKEHKKGLMQNLFPQEGETVPKVRFKEFENDGEWVKKKLGEVAEIITGNTPSTSEPTYYGGDKMFVSPADISDKRIVSQTKTKLTELGFSKTRKIKAGSVLFVCIGSTIGKVAQNKFDCATNQQLNSLVAFNDFSSDYLYSLLDANSSEIASIAGNHAVPIINKSAFSEIKLPFPTSLKEQQKIASCLSSLDALITAQAEKITQLQLHKKGLMQGLFPKMNN